MSSSTDSNIENNERPLVIEICNKDKHKEKVRKEKKSNTSSPKMKALFPKVFRKQKPKEKSNLSVKSKSVSNKSKRMREIPISRMGDEIVNDDFQYFLAFCSLVYLIRAVLIIYLMTKSLLNTKSNYNLIEYTIDSLFTISCIVTAITCFISSWMICFSLIVPFIISLGLSSLFICFKVFKSALIHFRDSDTESLYGLY